MKFPFGTFVHFLGYSSWWFLYTLVRQSEFFWGFLGVNLEGNVRFIMKSSGTTTSKMMCQGIPSRNPSDGGECIGHIVTIYTVPTLCHPLGNTNHHDPSRWVAFFGGYPPEGPGVPVPQHLPSYPWNHIIGLNHPLASDQKFQLFGRDKKDHGERIDG